MTMAPRPCGECGRLYAPSKGVQRFCSTSCRGKSQERDKLSRGREAKRDRLAPSIVRDWPPATRARVRAVLAEEIEGANRLIACNTEFLALIDKVSSEDGR